VLATPMPGDYLLSGRGRGAGSSLPYLYCALCGESIPMQSNLAIAEELLRIFAYLERPSALHVAMRNASA